MSTRIIRFLRRFSLHVQPRSRIPFFPIVRAMLRRLARRISRAQRVAKRCPSRSARPTRRTGNRNRRGLRLSRLRSAVRRSQQGVTDCEAMSEGPTHSPRQDASHQAKPPRRRAIPPLLSCDCRLQPSPQDACQKRYFARMRGTTGSVGSGRVSRT